jgi:hypothetical protein
MKSLLEETDGWLRRRIRMCIWKWWKKVKTRFRNLKRCGIDKARSLKYANARQGYWRMSSHPIINEAISVERLRRAGYPTLLEQYRKLTS